MRSIERRFKIEEDKAPLVSTFCLFARAVKGQRFNEKTIDDWFTKLVDKGDYERSDRPELILYLVKLSNSVIEECQDC